MQLHFPKPVSWNIPMATCSSQPRTLTSCCLRSITNICFSPFACNHCTQYCVPTDPTSKLSQ